MIALFIIIAVYTAKEVSVYGSTAHTNSLNSHLSISNPRHTNNKPQRFLRWRATQESPIILTNEDDNKDGTYLKFNNINLKLSPVNLLSYEGQIGGHVYETFNNNNEMDGIMRVLQSVLESHINSTLLGLGSEEEDIIMGSSAYVKLGNVKLLSASYDLASEPVRSLKEEERELQSSKEGTITIKIEGGEVYYEYGLGGELLSTLPTEDELSSLLIDSLESLPRSIQSTTYTTSQVDNLGEDSDPAYEDLFFGMFDDVNDVMTVESVPVPAETDEPTRFPTTSMPTDEPTLNPVTNAPTDQPSKRPITESPISNAPVATPTTSSPTTSSPITSIPTEVTSVPTVPAEEIPTPELPTTTFLPTEDVDTNTNTDNNKGEPITGQDLVAVIAEANSAANSKPDTEEGNNTTIILAASISGLVVVFAILALFVYKRRRSTSGSSLPLSSRSDDDDADDGVVMKAVPLSSTIGSDDFNSSGEEGGLFDNSRGEKKTDQERDLESGNGNNDQGSSNAPKSQHSASAPIRNMQPSSQVGFQQKTQEQDEAYDKMLANAMVAGISKKRGSVQMANKSLMSSDTFAKAKPLPMDTNADEEEEEDTLDALAKGQPLGRHDSLTGAVQLTRDISDFDVLAGAAAAKEELVFDDIDKAMKFADIHINTVAQNVDSVDDDEIAGEIRDDTDNKIVGSTRPQSCPPPENSRPPMAPSAMHHHSRPTTPSLMTRQDSFASRDILNDINAAAEKRRQIERQNGRSTPTDLLRALTPTNDAALKNEDVNMIDAEPDANYDDINRKPDVPSQKEPEEENYDILDTISQVVRSKEASTRGVPLTSSAKHGSAESTNIVSPSAIQERKRSSDPPGIITLEQNQDDLTLFTEMNTTEEQPTLARRAACGISNTLSSMVCKEGNGRQTPTKGMTMKWNPTLSNNRAPHYISDESSDEGDIISKPWMQKWNTDEFKEQTLVSPPVSNYDPDSEWDVSDAEIEEGTKEEDMRIW